METETNETKIQPMDEVQVETASIQQQSKKKRKVEEGIDLAPEYYISMRKDTIATIISLLEKNNIILVRSPPYTGKTSLAQLLELHFNSKKQENERVISLSFLRVNNKEEFPEFDTFWTKKTGASWSHWLNRKEPTKLILDESQMVYQNPEGQAFWQTLKDMCKSTEMEKYKHIQIIVFSAYGDRPGSGTQFATPFAFPAVYGVRLLFCTASEAHELVENFNKKNEVGIKISKEMEEHLYKITEGHIGLLSRTLEGIEEQFKNQAKYTTITDEKIASYLLSANFIGILATFRAAPQLDNLDENEKTVLDSFLLHDIMRLAEDEMTRKATFGLIKKGILRYFDKGMEQNYATSVTDICFISLLIRQICFYRRCSSPRPDTGPATLEDFLLQCLQRIKPSYLANALGKGILRGEERLLERTWQMEFYRVATSVLPSDCFISVDVGHTFGTKGMVDFYVNDKKKWIVEATREGDRLGEHDDRLKPGGLYEKIASNGAILLDFRHESKAVRGPKIGIWYVCYNPIYTEATILRKDQSNIKVHFLGDLMTPTKGSLHEVTLGLFPHGQPDEMMAIKIPLTTLTSDVRKHVVEQFNLTVHPSKIVLMKGDATLDLMHTLGEAGVQSKDKLAFVVKQ